MKRASGVVLDVGAFIALERRSGAPDPVDAHVVFLARERSWPVLTSDANDLLAVDPTLTVETI